MQAAARAETVRTAEAGLTVPVLAPTGRDGLVACEILKREMVRAVACGSLDELAGRILEGCGPAVVAEEAFTPGEASELLGILNGEPGWSDLPLVVMAGRGGISQAARKLGRRRSTTVLRRPIDVPTFVGMVRSGIESRKRQYVVRDLLNDLQRLNEALQHRAHQLQQLALQLSEAEHRERERVAGVLHDHLQQILAAAKMGLGAVQRQPLPEAVEETIREVNGLLSEAIDSSRTLSYELSPPILRQSGLGEAIHWLAREIQQKHGLVTKVRTDTMEEAPEPLRAFLYQATRELLFNVVKHGGINEAEVFLDAEDGFLRLCVRDEGRGFDPHGLRLEGGERGGFGLLSIHERVSALGGALDIESAPGEGSRFRILVPMLGESAARIDRKKAPEAPGVRPSSAEERPGKRVRVLVADDHRVMRQGLVSLLADEPDIEVVGEADNGLDAVGKTRELRPDVVVMDVSMPILDGIGATRRILTEMPDTRVVGLSMFEEADIERRMIESGAAAYLTKSGPSDLLLAAIRAARETQTSGGSASPGE